MSKSEKQYSMKLKYNVIIIALFLFQFFTSFVMAQNDEFETFNLNTKVDKVGWNEFVSLYKETGELYLPIVQLFEYLKINIEEKQSGAVVEGFFIDSKTNYRIDTSTRQFTLGQKTIGITENDFLVSQGELYISSVFIKQQFGIETNFDFRSLSANISAPFLVYFFSDRNGSRPVSEKLEAFRFTYWPPLLSSDTCLQLSGRRNNLDV